jgi:hypothetical protein
MALPLPPEVADAEAEAGSALSTAVLEVSVSATSGAPSALVVASVGRAPSAVESPGAVVTLLTPSVLASACECNETVRTREMRDYSQALAEHRSGGEHSSKKDS